MTVRSELERDKSKRRSDEIDWDGVEQRLHERYSAEDFFCRIFDRDTQMPLGDLIDISLGGLGLKSSSAIAVGQAFRLRVVRTVEGGAPDVFEVNARCSWVNPNASMGYFESGFEFAGLTEAARAGVERLIDLLGHVGTKDSRAA
jgi:c-di-GMP-binding flagellar brake protein YcgR